MKDPCAEAWDRGHDYFSGPWSEYAQALRLPGSALRADASVDLNETPWIVDPLKDCNFTNTGVRFNTLVKPVQAGGSVAGELAICCAIRFLDRGDIQYNWEHDEKAKDRWKKRAGKILAINAEAIGLPSDRQICLIVMDRLNFTMQGVISEGNLASDSIRFQVNEEIHNWEPGKLATAYGRLTAYEPVGFQAFNISNASNVDDQLHKALLAGTNREWTVKCPGCRRYHAMRFRWDEHEPNLGGLRWDSKAEGVKMENGGYNYNRLAPTIRYQMPCGYRVGDDVKERRALSDSGKYSDPRNPGAHVSNESRTFEAVSVHYISWLSLIQEWHSAIQSFRYGDPEPLNKFRRERECRFVDPEDRPLVQQITVRADVKKDRAGLAGRQLRLFALDRQKGKLSEGEFPHWWLVIADVGIIDFRLKVQIVFEGKILTDEDVIEALTRHSCQMHHGVADSGWDPEHAYVRAFCMRHGIHAIKGEKSKYFSHENGAKRCFAKEKPLHAMIGAPSKFEYRKRFTKTGEVTMADPREPHFWLYSKHGIRERLYYLLTSSDVDVIIPSDVSKDFRAHMESEMPQAVTKTDGSIEIEWHQVRERNDLRVCLCYIAMQMDRAGLIGSSIGMAGPISPKP